MTLRSRAALSAKSLTITAVDSRGKEEMYGLFDVGRAYGREAATTAIPWQTLRAQMDQRLQTMGYERSGESLRRNDHRARPVAVDFAVSSEGMQSINFDQLAEAGLDLRGVDPDSIAVTLKGEPVARNVVSSPGSELISSSRRRNGSRASAGSASEIHFWGETPDYPDALYVSEYVYRVSVDAEKARPATEIDQARWRVANQTHTESILINEDNDYSFTSVLDDPWYAARLQAGSGNDSYSASINVPSNFSMRDPARIEVVVAGVTDFSVSPDHHVEVLVNGHSVAEAIFDGQTENRIRADLEPGILKRGENQVTVRLPGGTTAPADLVFVDTVKATFTSRLVAENDRLLVERGQAAEAFQAYGLSNDPMAYAFSGDALMTLPVDKMGRGSVVFPAALGGEASYWVSGRDALHRPALIGAVGPSNTARRQPADFVVIAHPAFMPATPFEAHPLNDFVDARESDGWSVRVVDVTDIQLHYGGGMALPGAVTNFLREVQAEGTSHVLLVGGDSYDYHDRLGLGSISHIPTLYAPTKYIGHTPSDALLADVDGNGVSDLALGRWPVRSMSDLHSSCRRLWTGSSPLRACKIRCG